MTKTRKTVQDIANGPDAFSHFKEAVQYIVSVSPEESEEIRSQIFRAPGDLKPQSGRSARSTRKKSSASRPPESRLA